jgi:serine/threonine-protein kinase RsbW/stage II sporulation protein AB (anti-sigma F factor)
LAPAVRYGVIFRGNASLTVSERSVPTLSLRLPAVPGAASDARRAVHAVATGQVANSYAVALAVSEAVANVVVHAYRNRGQGAVPGDVHVTVTVDPDELLVVVADRGVGMTARPDSPGAGLGLPIIATLADRFEVQQLSGGTRVLLGFRRTPLSEAAS